MGYLHPMHTLPPSLEIPPLACDGYAPPSGEPNLNDGSPFGGGGGLQRYINPNTTTAFGQRNLQNQNHNIMQVYDEPQQIYKNGQVTPLSGRRHCRGGGGVPQKSKHCFYQPLHFDFW